MLTTALSSVAFTTIAVIAAYLLAPKDKALAIIRIAAIWVLAAAIAFFGPTKWMVMFLLAVLLAAAAPLKSKSRVYVYIGVLAAIPITFTYQVPFPGLNYLVALDYSKIATLAILGPVFVQKSLTVRPQSLKSIDRYLLVFVLLTGFMSIRDVSFTSMLRATIDQYILVYIPYVAISRTLDKQETIETALKALFASFIILTAIGVISTIKSWNYYVHLSDYIFAKSFIEYRNNFLRISATLIPSLLAFLMGGAMLLSYYFRRTKALSYLYFIGFLVVFSFVLFVTGARGGWLAAMAVFGAYFMLSNFGKMGRNLLVFGAVSGIAGMFILIYQDSSLLNDEFGTLSYRADLIRTSMGQIAERPLFGSADFLNSPRFAHLYQGEGIIDLVNTYLQITLYYGLTGLGLYLGAHFGALNKGMSLLGSIPRRGADENAGRVRRILCVLAAMHFGFLTLIATVSAVSYVWHYGYLILAILTAQVRLYEAAAPARAKAAPAVEAGEVSALPPEQKQAKPVTPPYGARFVRRS